MVMTVLEAHVEQGHTDTLKQAYHEEVDRHMLPSIYQTFLVHALNDPSLWRIITVWRSREDLQAMRQQGTPAGVLIFRAAGAEPVLSILDVDDFAPGAASTPSP